MEEINLVKELVYVRLTEEYKQEVFELVENTIDKVLSRYSVELNDFDRRTLRHLCYDQVNIHISRRVNTKTMWTFDAEKAIPILVERESSQPAFGEVLGDKRRTGSFKMKPNLTWTYNSKNNSNYGKNRTQFEAKVLDMLKEDFETAAFYGTLSLM